MSEEIKELEEIVEDTGSENTSDAFSGVFSSAASDAVLGGSEYIGSFDELLKSLGIEPITGKQAEDIPLSDEAEKRLFVSAPDSEDKQEYVPYNEDTYLENAKKQSKNSQSKKFMQNFRVLSKKTGDRTLLEAAPTGKAKGNVADSVKPEEGEDIFEAVERAESKKKKGVFNAKGKSAGHMIDKANKKKKEEVLMKAKELAAVLAKQTSKQKIQLILLGVIALVSAVFCFLPSLYTPEGPLEILFGDGGRVFVIVNIVLLLLGAAAGYDRLFEAFKTIKGGKLSSSTGLFIMFVLVLVHNIVLLFLKKAQGADIKVYTVYFVFSLIAAVISENLKAKTALRNLSVVVKSGVLESVHTVENKLDSSVLSKGLNKKGADKVLYCAQADSIKGLNGNLGKRTGEDKFYNFLHLTVLAASLIAGIVVVVRSKDAAMFVTAIVACICLCGPIMCELARTVLLYIENKKLNSNFAAVTSYEGLKTMEKASAVAMDASDVFTAKVTKFRAVKGSRLSTHDCAVLAAATLKDSGSLMWSGFAGFENDIEGELPEAEDLQYESKRGFSCVCAGRNVMVGNRRMLLKNEIEAPSKEEEKQYARNKCAMYVVVDGILSATFLVSYNVIPSLQRAVVGFNKTGLVLLLTAKDPGLNENLISLKLGCDISCVKVLSEDASELMDEYRLNRSMRQANSLVCSKRKKGLFELVVKARNLAEGDKFVLYMHVAGQVLAFMMLLLSVIVNVPAFMSPFVIMALQLIWGAISVFITTRK
ncbi:MAG: hypothetical protein IJW86_09335 [Clostridia bacterium]|nr:hypothetical protein [Clostridia bacterium]